MVWAQNTLANTLTARVDRTTISADETLNLEVIFEGAQTNSTPDFSVLSKQFEILNNQKSMQHSIMNGRVSASTQWSMTLLAKSTGQLLIPPFSLEGQVSRPITITVKNAQTDPVSGLQDVFLETEVSKESAFVQEQIIITYRLYFNRSVDSLDREELNIDSARIEELPTVKFQKVVNQKPYGVAEFRYAVFPDASGVIKIPEKVWTVRTTDQANTRAFPFGNSGRFKLHRVKTDALNIEVNPKPDDYPLDQPWLPAKNVSISDQWSRPSSEFVVGEPITRTVVIKAAGVSSEQLPPVVNTSNTDQFKFYPDQPNQENNVETDGVVGTRTESVAIVPQQAGELTLPEVSVTWWDTDEQAIKTATLAAQKVFVQAGAAAQASATQAITPNLTAEPTTIAEPTIVEKTPLYWPLLTLLFALIAAAELVWILYFGGQKTPAKNTNTSGTSPNLAAAWSAVRGAAKAKDSEGLRAAAIELGKQLWPKQSQVTLELIGQRASGSALAQELKKLDASLYRPTNEADNIDFERIISELKANFGSNKGSEKDSGLAPLYG